MNSLVRSIGQIWEETPALCALVPYNRVFTGRIPATTHYPFPYVSILATSGVQTRRTDKTRYSSGPLTFHVWVDDAKLETGELIAATIVETYADRCWALSDTADVIDVRVSGEPAARQTLMPDVKAWEIIVACTVHIKRDRVQWNQCGIDMTPEPEISSSSS
jgi:hypothetical protein